MCQTLEREPRRRERRHASHYRFCRKVKGDSYQARLWMADLGSINLGCFRSEWQAGHASQEFVRRYRPGADVCDVIDSLRRDGTIPPHIRPKYVFDLPGGAGFASKVRKDGKKIVLPGPYPTEREAHAAMVAHLQRLPRPPKPARIQGPNSPYASPTSARKTLGITPGLFAKHWAPVFTNPLSCRSVVFKDELSVAILAGGGTLDSAKEAVAVFRMGMGRLRRGALEMCAAG